MSTTIITATSKSPFGEGILLRAAFDQGVRRKQRCESQVGFRICHTQEKSRRWRRVRAVACLGGFSDRGRRNLVGEVDEIDRGGYRHHAQRGRECCQQRKQSGGRNASSRCQTQLKPQEIRQPANKASGATDRDKGRDRRTWRSKQSDRRSQKYA
jgi:hypothetical protein